MTTNFSSKNNLSKDLLEDINDKLLQLDVSLQEKIGEAHYGADNAASYGANEKKAEYLLEFISKLTAEITIRITEISSYINNLKDKNRNKGYQPNPLEQQN